ncbi:MAG: serine/threonine-protein kinase, partial [Streptosporangiaceae bacterium]
MPDVLPLRPGDPDRLGDCVLTGRLGEGAQGVVFLGSRDDRPVVVKLLHARMTGDAAERFLKDLRAVGSVGGSGFARFLGADLAGDWPYVVSELVDGPSLQRMISETGRGSRATVERLAVGVALSLTQIHRAGILQLDLKPANVLLGPDGPRLIDVGVARALADTRLPVSPAYLSPEQLQGSNVGTAADVWAWGATVAFAASGNAPFGDDRPLDVSQRILEGQPDVTRLPDSLRDLVLSALTKDPFRRPSTESLLACMLGRGLELPGGQNAEARAILDGPAAAAQPADPFAGPYLPPAGEVEPSQPNPTALWEALPAAAETRRRSSPLQDKRFVKGLGALVVGVLGGIIAITLIWGGLGDDRAPAPQVTPEPTGETLVGAWHGRAVNQNGVKFDLDVVFLDAQKATTKMSTGPCTGELRRVGESAEGVEMNLTITSGQCTQGKVTLKDRGDGRLRYVWTRPGSRLHYEATLT